MPIVTRTLEHVRPQRDGTVRVQEMLIATVGHRITHSYKAVSEAQAIVDMNARDVTAQLKDADFADLLAHVEIKDGVKNQPSTFDFTGRDITLIEGEDFLYKLFAESTGGSAIKIAWWLKGMNNPTFIPIRNRAGHDTTEGNRVKDKAAAQDDAEDTIDDVVEVEV